jgi:hypothetical protein
MRDTLVYLQAATFVGLAVLLCREGELRLALAQALLAVITVAVYL